MKKPRKPSAAAPKSPEQSVQALLVTAQGHALAGRWREATAAYKTLIKSEDRPEWRLALAAAYAARARELAAKGMPKEALTLWENRALIAPDLPPDPAWFALLLRLGEIRTALDLLPRAQRHLDAAALTALRSHLAALHLAGEPALAAGLAADDPIRTHGPSAAAALDAYCRGDDPTLREALAALSFRSPYRDLALVLKALQRASEAPDEAAALLARIGDDSGFAPLRRACTLALGGPARTLPERLAGAGEHSRRFALTLAGWGDERAALWEETRKVTDRGPQALLRLLQRRRALLGEDWARRRALRLLIPGFPKSAGLITEGGGRPLSPQERLLVAAWHAEDSRDPGNEIDAWARYANHLIKTSPGPAGSDNALRIALVLRRVDSNREVLSHLTPSDDPHCSNHVLADALTASLDYDPDDRDCYERLVRYYLRGGEFKTARPLLDQGLKRFPKDLGLLTAAMDAALAGDAFKKAARYAREILALDPINTGAQERLVKAHLAHARKQLRAARPDLARRELELADEWDQGGRRRDQRDLLAALLDLAEDEHRGQTALRARVAALGGGLSAALALALEAGAIGRSAAWALRAADLGKLKPPAQADLTAFLARLRGHLEGGAGLAPELRLLFDKPLSAAAKCPLSLAESEAACDTLRRAELTRARLAFAEAAVKRWPEAPVFVLHQFESRQAGSRRDPSSAELDRLENAADQAQQAGDVRTAHRIHEVIDRYVAPPFFPGPLGGFFTDDPMDPWAGPDPGQPMIDPDQAMRALVEVLGFDELLKLGGLSAQDRAEYKQRERQVGREQVIEEFLEMVREEMLDFGLGGPPGPRPRPKGKRGGRRPCNPGPADDAPPDDDSPEQLNLF